MLAAAVSVLGIAAMPILGSPGGLGAVGLIIGSIVRCAGKGAFSPTSLTLRQTQTPPELLARVAAVQRFLLWGAIALGFLLAAAITTLGGAAHSGVDRRPRHDPVPSRCPAPRHPHRRSRPHRLIRGPSLRPMRFSWGDATSPAVVFDGLGGDAV
ncbi:hypothetical protein [Nonomuraea typhae]|uniref:hypothetical protein n=1 Tax=Nonomuraea typhae TaxID=2603600 RepID=UPI0015E1CFBB|nr:hypothetical protein [Nonomuraea typhae]